MEVDDPWAYMDGWVDMDFYLDQLTAHNNWWEKATRFGLKKISWDMAFSWVGTIDHIQHVLYGESTKSNYTTAGGTALDGVYSSSVRRGG